MLNVSHVLDRNNIRSWNITHAVGDIAAKVNDSNDPLYMATKLFNDILSVSVTFTDAVHARIAAKHMIKDVLTYKCVIDNDDVSDIIEQAIEYADSYCADPANSYLWSQPDSDTSQVRETVQVVEGIDMKVAVRDDGKIKKGGKQLLAAELYAKFVLNATAPVSNQEFVQILIDSLDMTKPGATTYAYNLRKANKVVN